MTELRVLDLFSGIGGFSLGLERAGMKTVAFCEIDPFCQKVLRKHWPDVPIYNDVRSFDYDGSVDVICGGYPCQPDSTAGKRKGTEDDRYLWPAIFSLIKKHRPTWVIGENVAGHITMGLDGVLADLASEDYDARTFIIPALSVDAKHRRDRTWIVAHSKKLLGNVGINNGKHGKCEIYQFGNKSGQNYMADTKCTGLEGRSGSSFNLLQPTEGSEENGWLWPPEPDVGRVAHGIPDWVDRLKSLGNAVVPQIPEIIGRAVVEIHRLGATQ